MDDSVDLGVVYSENLDDLSDEGDYEAGEDEEEDVDVEEEEDDDEVEAVTPSSGKILYIYTFFLRVVVISSTDL